MSSELEQLGKVLCLVVVMPNWNNVKWQNLNSSIVHDEF